MGVMPMFELQIWLPGRGALRQLVRADSLQRALEIAQYKWPHSKIEVPPPVAKKPRLVRSSTCPRAAARARAKIVQEKRMQTQPAQWAKEAWMHVQADQARVDFLEKLYLEDGRDSKGHPLHSTYTGLYLQYLDQMNVEHVRP